MIKACLHQRERTRIGDRSEDVLMTSEVIFKQPTFCDIKEMKLRRIVPVTLRVNGEVKGRRRFSGEA